MILCCEVIVGRGVPWKRGNLLIARGGHLLLIHATVFWHVDGLRTGDWVAGEPERHSFC